VKVPPPDPFSVLVVKEIVGLVLVPQHTPFILIVAPLSVTVPPDVAEVPVVLLDIAAVDTVGVADPAVAVNDTLLPYTVVPVLVVAYALTLYTCPAVSPVILLVKVPPPDPFSVLVVKEIVGLVLVPQHTPFMLIVAPFVVTVPPDVAVVPVIAVIAAVDTVGVADPGVVLLHKTTSCNTPSCCLL
jgi:hypothetical protein